MNEIGSKELESNGCILPSFQFHISPHFAHIEAVQERKIVKKFVKGFFLKNLGFYV